MHFNGTAGVWRRRASTTAGGWQHDTLTEDLDLSTAPDEGLAVRLPPAVVAPAELPPEMIGFKQQAHRWTKGSMQDREEAHPGRRARRDPGQVQDRGALSAHHARGLRAHGAPLPARCCRPSRSASTGAGSPGRSSTCRSSSRPRRPSSRSTFTPSARSTRASGSRACASSRSSSRSGSACRS